jgi:IstB-like ATP binding protein
MIFTTDKPLNAWGRVLHDDDLAHAIVDRILERGRMLTLDGPSMRTKHLGLDDQTPLKASDQLATISGIEAPEFPEPTHLNRPGSWRHFGDGQAAPTTDPAAALLTKTT